MAFYTQPSMTTAQFHNDTQLSLGTDKRPPVLVHEDQFDQWKDRFLEFLKIQPNGMNMIQTLHQGPFPQPFIYVPPVKDGDKIIEKETLKMKDQVDWTQAEINEQKDASEAKVSLMIALPYHIYNRIDCFKDNIKVMWAELEKLMLGSAIAVLLRENIYMQNYESFRSGEGESLKSVFNRFWVVVNDIYKINYKRSCYEKNLKFLYALQPEWEKVCHKMRNDPRL